MVKVTNVSDEGLQQLAEQLHRHDCSIRRYYEILCEVRDLAFKQKDEQEEGDK